MSKKLKDLLLLAIDLQSSSVGLTKLEIKDKCLERGISPSMRTIERWLKELVYLGLSIENLKVDTDHHNVNRYHIKNLPNSLMNLSPVERSSLERLMLRLTDKIEKNAISKIIASQKSLSNAILNDLIELIENTYYAGLITPKIIVENKNMMVIENAIKGAEILKFDYESDNKKTNEELEVKPLGLLFGRFGYLICMNYKEHPMTYRLDLIKNVKLTGLYFEKNNNFNFKKYAKESFGIYHGDKIMETKLWFDKSIAKRVKKINFHPSQSIKHNKDGSIILSLICGGHRELIWEIFHPDYLGNVKILEPNELKLEASKYLSELRKI